MKKMFKYLSIIGLMLLLFTMSPLKGQAEDGQLLYDLRYDETKSVLYGKTKPNANVYINDLAGNIVADEKGDFEMPVPKGLKVSTVLMLDAEGDNSTDVRFNFEKNTIETENSSDGKEATSLTSSSEEKKENSSEKEVKSKESETKESIKETVNSKEKASSGSSSLSANQGVSSDSYNPSDYPEEKRSLVWLWTLLIVVGVLGLAAGTYMWYKKKIEKEEAEKESRRRKRHSKDRNKQRKNLDDDFEDDLYESLKTEEKITSKRSSKNSEMPETDLDSLIDSELKRDNLESERVKTSRSRNGKKRRKKKVK